MLLAEIRDGFANLPASGLGQLQALPHHSPAWIYRTEKAYGVAIDLHLAGDISERFSGARLYTQTVEFHGKPRRQLRLECGRASLRNEFAAVCAQFLEPGEAGAERQALMADPLDWWRRWRQLLGNALRDKKPYSVLGELLAWERLLDLGEAPSWQGPKTGSHDLEVASGSYEIKSTVTKYESRITIAGQFQLKGTGGKPLYLVFQRFEPSDLGESIDDAVGRLVSTGADAEAIEEGLETVGFELGTSGRKTRYRLLESVKYVVDDAFPRVTPESFVGGVLPAGIVSLQYEVNLASIQGAPF